MKTLKYLSIALFSTLVLFSCKKDDETPSKTTLQKIQAKWTYQKSVEHEFSSGVHTWDTSYYSPSNYVDFRTDGKVYSFYGGTYYDTANYSLIGDTKLVFSVPGPFGYTDTNNISVLNDNQLQLHFKEFYPAAPDYYEYTDHYVK